MRRSRVIAAAIATLLTLGLVGPPAGASPLHDPATQTSLRNLVTAMEWYTAFDGGNRFTGVTERALAGWGWRPTANKYVERVCRTDR